MDKVLPILFLVIILAGLVMMLIGVVRIWISAFRKSILWGLGCLFVPVCKLVYIIVDWENAKSGFFLYLKGFGVLVLAIFVAAITVPRTEAAKFRQRVHARESAAASTNNEQVAASPSDKQQSATGPIEKSQPLANPSPNQQSTVSVSHKPVRLQGISYNPTRPSAIINGNTFFVGEKVADWTVTAISNQAVTLQDSSGQTNILSLH
jgi:hypothetical protein